jgi:hypothetical protein
MTPIERFLDKVEMIPEHPCWEWIGTIGNHGYGEITINYNFYLAHRLSWKLHFSEIPKGLYVCHKCDNKTCVNPNHLFLGTDRDNMLDKCRKGRHHNSKKTHCPRGHEYSGSNVAFNARNARWCKQCEKERIRVW